MPGLNRNVKVFCENYVTQFTKRKIVRHKIKCSTGSLTYPSCTKFSTKSRAEMNYQISKNHSNAHVRVVHEFKNVTKFFTPFTVCENDHDAERSSEAQNVDVAHVMGDTDDNSLKEEKETCKHFLVNSQMENGRHRVSNFAYGYSGSEKSVVKAEYCV